MPSLFSPNVQSVSSAQTETLRLRDATSTSDGQLHDFNGPAHLLSLAVEQPNDDDATRDLNNGDHNSELGHVRDYITNLFDRSGVEPFRSTCMSLPEESTGQQVPGQLGDDRQKLSTTSSHAEVTSTEDPSAGSTTSVRETNTTGGVADAASGEGAVTNAMRQPDVPDVHEAADVGINDQSPPTSTAKELDPTATANMGNDDDPKPLPGTKLDASSTEALERRQPSNIHTAQPTTSVPIESMDDDAPVAGEPSDAMSSSVLTIKPANPPSSAQAPNHTDTQLLSPDQLNYVDPTPPTPVTSQPPSRAPSAASRTHRSDDASPSRSNTGSDDKPYTSEDDQEGGSRSEIQSIMEQFSESGGGPGAEEVMSPRLEIASPMLNSPVQHPPRKSSFEPLAPTIAGQIQDFNALRISTSSPIVVQSREQVHDDRGPPVPPKDGTTGTPPKHRDQRAPSIVTSPTSPQLSMHRPPPPEPEPEPVLPFDFHRFLEQLRNKKADPVARYLKSFLTEFGKRQWMVHEQVKIISDFLAFIANKMMICEVWRDVSDAEFDNAREGMEKLVMNRLYSQTFSPAIPPPKPIPGAKPKRKGGDPPLGPGRRGQHQEDVERDDIVTQKINIYGWVKEEHLDIPPVGDSGRRFLKLAQQELLKIKSYRAPRDKIICVLNCCKVIFGLLKHNKSDSSADSFMPLLIYVVLQSNPEHLVSNVQYILRFRNQEKLGGEAGYYLSSLMGAVQFIENMDRTSLTISDDEFEKNVEAAVSAIAEKHQAMSPKTTQQQQQTFNEKTSYESERGRPSLDGAGPSTPRQSTSSNEDAGDERAAISGLLRTIQNPLTTIGRIFSDEGASSSSNARSPPSRPQESPAASRRSREEARDSGRRPESKHSLSAEEAAARQASAEVAEAQRLHRAEHANIVETLAGMFPDLDKDIISDVVYQKEGRVGLAVDACLALST
ncbi:Vacuolar protein sorting-associated protein 9a [Cladobotryum mycophilum]|uniref:Vacuolar protein sorting-associated protein 9a n=1 Tax=Cladobotryum mycophilum TaxID=491253 RepID=A0ABR0SEZ6_9HYPO